MKTWTESAADWDAVAKQVMAGEFDGCDNSTRDALTTGLRGFYSERAKAALAKLKDMPDYKPPTVKPQRGGKPAKAQQGGLF